MLNVGQRSVESTRTVLDHGANQHASIDATSQTEAANLLNESRPPGTRAGGVRLALGPKLRSPWPARQGWRDGTRAALL